VNKLMCTVHNAHIQDLFIVPFKLVLSYFSTWWFCNAISNEKVSCSTSCKSYYLWGYSSIFFGEC